MIFMLIILIPYLLLATAYFFSLRAAIRSRSPSRILFLPALLASILLTAGFLAWGFLGIKASTSSTAAIGYVVLPYMALICAILGYIFALAVGVVLRFIAERAGWASTRLTSVSKLIGAILFLTMVGWITHHNVVRSRLLDAAESETTDASSLQSILDTAIKSQDRELLSKLSTNPNLPEDLRQQLQADDSKQVETPSETPAASP